MHTQILFAHQNLLYILRFNTNSQIEEARPKFLDGFFLLKTSNIESFVLIN